MLLMFGRKVFLIVIILLCLPAAAVAIVASSPSYEMERDSINFGGILSNSSNYSLEDTAGEIATGPGSSSNFNIQAGYQQMDDSATISVSASGTVTLSPSFDNQTAGTATGQSGVVVVTNNSTGYNLYIQASASPALSSSGDSFSDYSPAGSDPDFTFSAPSGGKAFGYSPEGSDVVSQFKDDGSSCNTGSSETVDSCWAGLTTSPVNIATASSLNSPNGTYTTVKLKAAVGSGASATAGSYSATLVYSAVMQ